MKTVFIEYKQSDITLLSGVLNSKIINENASAVLYGKDPWGYQRGLKDEHVNGIVKYLQDTRTEHMFPNSIILALDDDKYKNLSKISIVPNVFEIEIKDVSFRIVDGQHRLEAIKKANVNLDLNIIVLIIPKNKRHIELDVFTTINSKAKRIPTDLAELAKFKYILLSEADKLNEEDSINYVAMKTAIDLNEKNIIWKNAIKVDINSDENIGIVGISAFKKTIHDIVKKSIESHKLTIEDLDIQSKKIANMLGDAWDICSHKWRYCFRIDESEAIFSKKYYIQKTLGISVIHGLLKEVYNGNITESIDKFKEIIDRSTVKISDWEVGGIMSGYSSESGFSKIRRFIKNEEQL